MKKLKLDVEQLAVESFDAGEEEKRDGTVRGYISIACDPSEPDTCAGYTCDGGGPTCDTCPKDSYDTQCYAC
jgi:hypothetical protein